MNNHFKTVMTVAFFSLCANLFAATPNFKFTGKTVDELLPSGWIVGSSKNYLTGKMYEYDVEQYQKKKGKWGVMEKAPLTSLESIVKK